VNVGRSAVIPAACSHRRPSWQGRAPVGLLRRGHAEWGNAEASQVWGDAGRVVRASSMGSVLIYGHINGTTHGIIRASSTAMHKSIFS
jgi:hypothetical protein